MSKVNDLTTGSIGRALWTMALPLISASFVQMAYNMTDMLWLGRLSSESVAAVGAGGLFTWLCNALALSTKTGAEITISQSLGAKDSVKAKTFAEQSILLSIGLSTLAMLFLFFGAPFLIGFFHFDHSIAIQGIDYLRYVAPGIFFTFNSSTFSGIYNGQGNSKTPFRIMATGLIINIIADPLLIYGIGPFPALGTVGAAIATTFSQLIVFALFIKGVFSSRFPLGRISLSWFIKKFSAKIIRLGFPVSLQNALFSIFSVFLATLAARWGHVGVAAQSIGSQIEAISWMTAAGFSTALATFVGQNYGAGRFDRIRQGYRMTMITAGSFGVLAGILFFVFNTEIFSLFVKEPEAIETGGIYLKILSISQLFMITESVTAGAFNGRGRTIPPSLTGIILTGARIPLAYYLTTIPELGLTGVWWSITISSILKGTILPLWYKLAFKNK